jgi:hypothetical protein
LTATLDLTYDPRPFMVTTGERVVGQAVLANWPFVRCFPCLSLQLGVSEKHVRDAAQLLIVHEKFATAYRVCQVCGRSEQTLVREKVP